jgi:hypothetical protein
MTGCQCARSPSTYRYFRSAELGRWSAFTTRPTSGRRAVLHDWLSPRQFLQRQFAAGVVELHETIENVPAVAHHFASLADVAELPGQLRQPNLGASDLLFLAVVGVVSKTTRPGCYETTTTPRPPRPALRL